jgi:hypothetical protein
MAGDDQLSSRIRCGLRLLKSKVASIDISLTKANGAGSMSLGDGQSQCFLLKRVSVTAFNFICNGLKQFVWSSRNRKGYSQDNRKVYSKTVCLVEWK